MDFDLGPSRILPRWVVVFFLGGAVVLIPWIVLMFTVPDAVDVTRRWELVWGGFDCFLVLGFARTAFNLIRRSPRGAVTAAMTGTMLLIDAWFDVLTTHRGGQLISILMAAFAEIPCALICFYVSRRITDLFEQTKEYLVAAGFTVQAGRVVPPAGFPGAAVPAEPPAAPVAAAEAAGLGNASGPEPAVAADPGPVLRQISERGLGAPVGQQGLLAEQL
ncbi:hypothetical protein KDK95_22370 [Actinospica sp. MGRD01-02]|uniref:Uncharacterized protein n=1 Tax=Actinospica acidithermotolerans TaxID=2828514 RepID=A0A941EK37_9ACTN|nr:hypothetical protein [Actinospica acidithermotolerans]MBR7829069.1 hypothetical protein [Actinospica acidithermotolerans]